MKNVGVTICGVFLLLLVIGAAAFVYFIGPELSRTQRESLMLWAVVIEAFATLMLAVAAVFGVKEVAKVVKRGRDGSNDF